MSGDRGELQRTIGRFHAKPSYRFGTTEVTPIGPGLFQRDGYARFARRGNENFVDELSPRVLEQRIEHTGHIT